jgi:D-sedoheptulose 7-phosphate isomerase
VGKRALPALALTNDSAALSGLTVGTSTGAHFAHQLAILARPADIALGFSADGHDANIAEALRAARSRGLLTVAMTGGDGGPLAAANLDFCFVVPSSDPLAVQETH